VPGGGEAAIRLASEHLIGRCIQAAASNAAILPGCRPRATIGARQSDHAMRPLPLAAALLLAACSGIETHRAACSQQLGLAATLAVKDSGATEPDPAVEACAQARRAEEERQVGQGIALGIGAAVLVTAAAMLGSGSGRSYRRGGYHRPQWQHRGPYRRGW
jgi:hypothetical protein